MAGPFRQTRKRLRMLKSRFTVRRVLAGRKTIQLEIGAGEKRANGWITLDLNKQCDIYWDLAAGLPFPDNSVHKIYSSHVLEHFTSQQIQDLLQECLRVLVRGGELSVCVPNAGIYIAAYVAQEELDTTQFFQPAFQYRSPIDYVNYMAYMDGHHRHMFDEANLVSTLAGNGFARARLRPFDPRIDLAWRQHESIYAEAFKPAA